jgi:RNA polymerase sigma-70 factor (ECF subfamily)
VRGETEIGGAAREFPDTRWTLIVRAKGDASARRAALEELLVVYWKPLYFRARRKGLAVEAAKDAIQGLFVHLLEGDPLARLDPSKGRFRSYLRAALDNWLVNLHEAESAQKRGGGKKTVALEWDVAESALGAAPADPDAAFDREWALGVIERALESLRAEFDSGKRKGSFDVVLRFFKPGAEPPSYADASKQAGMTTTQLKAFLHRARARFRELLQEQVAQTCEVGEGADELAALFGALR